jgi:hypothetical protein
MAVDKKSDHYNPPTNYKSIDGNMKTFTYVDHDKKTKISTSRTSEEEINRINKELADYKESLINEILSLPASLCPLTYHDFTIKGEGVKEIKWNEAMLKDPGMEIERLRTIKVMIENRMSLMGITIKGN